MTQCFECGEPSTVQHHVVPRSKGGTRTVPLCDLCHRKVHGRGCLDIKRLTIEALRRKQAGRERTGSIPYGYALMPDGKRLIKARREQRVIALARKLYVLGYTQRGVTRELEALGFRSRGGKPMALSQVQRFLVGLI